MPTFRTGALRAARRPTAMAGGREVSTTWSIAVSGKLRSAWITDATPAGAPRFVEQIALVCGLRSKLPATLKTFPRQGEVSCRPRFFVQSGGPFLSEARRRAKSSLFAKIFFRVSGTGYFELKPKFCQSETHAVEGHHKLNLLEENADRRQLIQNIRSCLQASSGDATSARRKASFSPGEVSGHRVSSSSQIWMARRACYLSGPPPCD